MASVVVKVVFNLFKKFVNIVVQSFRKIDFSYVDVVYVESKIMTLFPGDVIRE